MIDIRIFDRVGSFAEDKDIAAGIRKSEIRPAIDRGESVCIDFTQVEGATQSFVHAMISELIRSLGPEVLDNLEFRSCNDTIQSIIEIVTQYSQLNLDN